mmetsp:Transcript_28208/g.70744  ORF Transcript_28208/g.70744 Transcript_28208/m.70744 type:complete len:245 (+) Transcript_28208:238-972(+)
MHDVERLDVAVGHLPAVHVAEGLQQVRADLADHLPVQAGKAVVDQRRAQALLRLHHHQAVPVRHAVVLHHRAGSEAEASLEPIPHLLLHVRKRLGALGRRVHMRTDPAHHVLGTQCGLLTRPDLGPEVARAEHELERHRHAVLPAVRRKVDEARGGAVHLADDLVPPDEVQRVADGVATLHTRGVKRAALRRVRPLGKLGPAAHRAAHKLRAGAHRHDAVPRQGGRGGVLHLGGGFHHRRGRPA